MTSVVLVRYGEIALKSSFVRKNLERKLRENLVTLLRSANLSFDKVKYDLGRFFIYTNQGHKVARYVASRVFGVVSTSLCLEVTSDLSAITQGILSVAREVLSKKMTFAISARRIGTHPFTSNDVCVEGGQAILDSFPNEALQVDLSNPDQTIFVETRQKSTYVYTTVIPGLGGLPGKTQGRLVGLLEPQGASALAIWLAMRRGAIIDIISFQGKRTNHKSLTNFAGHLAKFLPEAKIVLREVDATPVVNILSDLPLGIKQLLWRRWQVNILSRYATKRKALGLVLGDVLFQNSPSAFQWLHQIDINTKYPIHRPLLALPREKLREYWEQMTSSPILPANFDILIPPPSTDKVEFPSTEEAKNWEVKLEIADRDILERAIRYDINKLGEE